MVMAGMSGSAWTAMLGAVFATAGALVSGGLSAPDDVTLVAAEDTNVSRPSPIEWRTPRVELHADRLTLSVGGETITLDGADVTISEHVQAPRSWYVVAEWAADDQLIQLALIFRSDGHDWFVQAINGVVSGLATPDGRPAYGGFNFGAANATRTPLGEAFTGDVRRSGDMAVQPCSPTTAEEAVQPDIEGVISIEGLQLSVEPRGRSLVERVLSHLKLDEPPGLDHFFVVACGRRRVE